MSRCRSAGWGGVPPPGGPEKPLAQIGATTIDIAADAVGVIPLHIGGRHDGTSEHPVLKARRKPLDLRFDSVGHVDRRTVGDVTVCPHRVFAHGCPRGIEEAGLRKQHVGSLRGLALPNRGF